MPRERAQRHAGEVTIGVRPEKLALLTSEPKASAGLNLVGPGRVIDVSFSGVSTQYQVQVPGLGLMTVFSQNMVFGPVVNVGAEVWLTWTIDHGFGLADDPADAPRFEPDEDTIADRHPAARASRGRARGGLRWRSAPSPRRRPSPRNRLLAGAARSRSSCCCRARCTSRCSSSSPFVSLILTSFQAPREFGDIGQYDYAFKWENYVTVVQTYLPHILRSFGYAAIATSSRCCSAIRSPTSSG